MYKPFLLSVCAAVLITGTPGCRGRQPQRVVRIGIQNNVFPALVLVAAGAGFFEDQGLDVSIVNYPSGKLALNAALAGEVDLCTVADMPVAMNSFERDDFRILCTLGYTDNGAWILARRDHGIETAADLVGKTIATQEGSAVHFFLSAFLVLNRIPASEVTITFMPAVELAEALNAGTIDALCMRNPVISTAKQALGDKAVEIFEPHAYRMFFTLVTRQDVRSRDPALARDIVAALVEAEAFARQDKAQAIAIVAQQLGPGREVEVAHDWDAYAFEIALGQDFVRGLENQAQWAQETGRADAGVAPLFRQFIDASALKAVRPESFTVIE